MKALAIFAFGVVFPCLVLVQTYLTLNSLSAQVNYSETMSGIMKTFNDERPKITNGNDYALISLLYSEHANQKTLANKQIMKVSIMQIGFAASSVGIMFILLGINDGGGVTGGEFNGFKFDFKTGSTGALIFVAGALMATAGGVVKNEYTSVPIPEYVQVDNYPQYEGSIAAYRRCRELEDEERFHKCFVELFKKVNEGVLR